MRASRREFLSGLAGMGAATLVGAKRVFAADVDPRVARIVADTIAVDMHSHVQVRFGERANPAIDLTGEMRRAGFSAVCQTYALDGSAVSGPEEYYTREMQGLAFEDGLLSASGLKRALTLKDLETAHAQKQPVIVQAVEGAQFLAGKLDRLNEVYGRGLRHLQLLHEKDDLVSPMGDVYTAPADHLGGLTAFGADVIKECNRLGILVDLAHGTGATVIAAVKVAAKPMIVSHTGMPGMQGRESNADMDRRLIPKDAAKAVADAGGVVGVWWRLSNSLTEYVQGIRAMVDVVGVDHAGIGTDSDVTASYALPYTNQLWPDENGGFFYAVAGEMLKQGFKADEISKIGGGNFCRVFGQATAGHA